jgi:hypothetical protein
MTTQREINKAIQTLKGMYANCYNQAVYTEIQSAIDALENAIDAIAEEDEIDEEECRDAIAYSGDEG